MRIVLLAAFVLMVAASAPLSAAEVADPAAAVVDSLVRGLTGGDWNALPLAEPLNVDDLNLLLTLTDVIQRYDCITVRSYRFVRRDSATVTLEIDASGVTRGRPRREVALPSAWVLEIVLHGSDWRLRAAESEERRAARLLGETPPRDWREALAARPDLDRMAFARELADVGADGRYTGVAGALDLALELARSAEDHATESFCLSMAALSAMTQNPNAAIDLARASIAAAEAANNPDALAAARFRLGITQWIVSRTAVDDALAAEGCRWLDSAASLIDSVEDPRIPIKSLYMSAYAKRLRGNVRDFLLQNERVIELSRLYWLEGAVVAQTAIGEFHMTTRNYALAVGDFRSAYENGKRAGAHYQTAEALSDLGIAQMSLGDAAAAAETFDRAERMYTAHHIGPSMEVAIQMGRSLMQNGKFAESESRLLSARQWARTISAWGPASEASAYLSALRLLEHRPIEALGFAREAIAEHSRVAVSTVEWSPWKALLAEGKALRALGEGTRAAAVLREAVTAVEDQRRAAPSEALASALFFEDKTASYLELIDLLIEAGKVPEAFGYAERMKGRALQDVLEGANVGRQSILSEGEKDEERSLTQRLSDLNKEAMARSDNKRELTAIRRQIAEARLSLERFETRIAITHPAVSLGHPPPDDGRRRLPAALRDAVVIEFVVNDRRTHVFAVSRGPDGRAQIIGRSIPVTRADLERRVVRLERQIAERDLGWRSSARLLYDLLLEPVDGALRAPRLICVVPDGVLWRIPFHLLMPRSGQTLMERNAVFYAPSLAMLQPTARRVKRPQTSGGELFALGNPTVLQQSRERVRVMTRDAGLGNLPDAESEVRAISALYGTGRSRIYLRDAARESVFKSQAAGFQILHLAAHGVFDGRSPMYSAIVLATAPDDADDGLLEGREIVNLHLGADLAVLASCDTGKGYIGAGEGLIGMSWAFLVAGCPTTVVSQWLADSKATKLLMVEFHRRFRAGDSPAEALRRAQLRVQADPRYADPLYWASFIVVGAGMREPTH